jgi:hypothetical protein
MDMLLPPDQSPAAVFFFPAQESFLRKMIERVLRDEE